MDESWLKAALRGRNLSPRDRLLTIFDILHEHLGRGDAADLLPLEVASLIEDTAREASFADPHKLAEILQMLMNGAALAARAGDTDAIRKAKQAADQVLVSWARTAP